VHRKSWIPSVRRILQAGVVFFALPTIWVVFILARFGSWNNAVSYYQGNSIAVEDSILRLDNVKKNSLKECVFNLKNLHLYPVRILGALPSCACTTTEDVPFVIGSNETHQFKLKVDIPDKDGPFASEIQLFTDDPRQKKIKLTFECVVN
jgi:hypothetical protein